MEKLSDEQLKCIQQNRERWIRRRSAGRVGDLAAELLQSGLFDGPAWRRQLVGVLEAHAGGELLKHATIVGVRGGVLRLHVAEPALMYSLRLKWEQRLIALLRSELPDAGIFSVRFTAGPNPQGT